MSIVNGTAGTGIGAIAQQLLQVFDTNRDGQLTTEEFTAVLNNVLGAASAAGEGAPTTSVPGRSDQLTGFSEVKIATSHSTKYRFARAAMQFDVSRVRTKADAEALLNQMRPAMAAQGLDVLEVKGDRIRVSHEGTPIGVDVIRGTESGAPMFQWLPV